MERAKKNEEHKRIFEGNIKTADKLQTFAVLSRKRCKHDVGWQLRQVANLILQRFGKLT